MLKYYRYKEKRRWLENLVISLENKIRIRYNLENKIRIRKFSQRISWAYIKVRPINKFA